MASGGSGGGGAAATAAAAVANVVKIFAEIEVALGDEDHQKVFELANKGPIF
jgi:hypothetical protein